MYSAKHIFIISVLMHIGFLSFGQQRHMDSVNDAITPKKWSLSLNLGVALIGPGDELNKELEKMGFGNEPEDFDFFGLFTIKNNEEFPRVTNAITWDMEARCHLTPKSAIGISFGKSLHYTAKGYRNGGYPSFSGTGYDYYLTIVHDAWFVSADYIFRLDSGHSGFSIGPVMAVHRVSEGSSTVSGNWTTSVKPGFHIGCDFPFFQKESWFMGFGLNYTWLPPTEISSNTESLRTTSTGSSFGGYHSQAEKNSIPLSTLQLSLTTGWRF